MKPRASPNLLPLAARQVPADPELAACKDDRNGAARKNNRTALGMVLSTLGHSVGPWGLFTLWFTSSHLRTLHLMGETSICELS